MIDNNLLLIIAIGVVIFLIINLNSKKTEKSVDHFNNNIEEFQNPSPTSMYNFPVTNAPVPDQTVINNILSNIPNSSTNQSKTIPAPSSAPSPVPDTLNNQYSSNLQGSPGNFNSNTTTLYAADYGQGYNLGVNNSDPALAKFTNQTPPQKSPLISDDLLPKKNENWFETPSVGTKVDDANLLADAVYKVGVDTVGSTRKNPSYDLRGNVPNPKFPVSPWNNSSYEPDNNLKGLCY